jgi:hypothetical protein
MSGYFLGIGLTALFNVDALVLVFFILGAGLHFNNEIR